MKPTKFRVARPTDRLAELRRFYVDGLGLTEVGTFRDHAGYDGLILRSEQDGYEIEFTSHVDGSPCPAPSRDNLLVFYLADRAAVETIERRFASIGCAPIEPENPYWRDKALTFADPDGWGVVAVDAAALHEGAAWR